MTPAQLATLREIHTATRRNGHAWQAVRYFVAPSGDIRNAQLTAGTRAECIAAAARWAKASAEQVEIIRNDAP